MSRLHNKVAIITGGAGGIGRATALLFAQEGARLAIADWNGEGAQAVADEITALGGQAIALQTDVSQSDSVNRMVTETLHRFGRIDILMNNAGIGGQPSPIHSVSEDTWAQVIGVCLTGVFLGMKYALPHMVGQKSGNIINVASIAGIIGSPQLGPYAAAKAGVIELTKTCAVEYSRYNIRCNCLAPGWTQTQMVEAYVDGRDDIKERMLQGVPMRRFGEVSEIAQAALFLAGDEAGFIQGHTLVLDGGITIA
jgi:NAD(P)-dependent dehydrogenase (short-subunit alcohol dehydrogenase family)